MITNGKNMFELFLNICLKKGYQISPRIFLIKHINWMPKIKNILGQTNNTKFQKLHISNLKI